MKVWVEAARPRTLVAGVVPVLVGTAAAERLIVWRFGAALVVGVAIQVGVNYANDYFDGVRGIDTRARNGPRRAVAAGLVAPAQMKTALIAAFSVAGVAGGALALAVNPLLLAVGAVCFAAALGYSGGPHPYASAGLGEVFVFVFFGVVATAGSAYVQDERIVAVALAAAVPVGLLAVAILVANNLRDVDADASAGKRTLAVRMGRARYRALFDACLAGVVAGIVVTAVVDTSPAVLLALLALPLLGRARKLLHGHDDAPGLIAALGATARAQLGLGALLAVGLWIS